MTEQERQKRLQRRREEREFCRCLGFFGTGVSLTLTVVSLIRGDAKSALIVAVLTAVAGTILWMQTPEVKL